jgi:hypothetical protein
LTFQLVNNYRKDPQLDANTRCGALLVNGRKAKGGTWGATRSAAEHIDDAIFSGPGVLTVGVQPFLIVVK